MKALFASIYGLFSAAPGGVHNALYAAIGDSLYNTGAPNTATFPLVTMSLISNSVSQTMEKCRVQFSIFSQTPGDTEVLAIYDALTALFDNASLPNLGNAGNLGMERAHCVLMHEEPVWHYVVEYEVWVARK